MILQPLTMIDLDPMLLAHPMPHTHPKRWDVLKANFHECSVLHIDTDQSDVQQ